MYYLSIIFMLILNFVLGCENTDPYMNPEINLNIDSEIEQDETWIIPLMEYPDYINDDYIEFCDDETKLCWSYPIKSSEKEDIVCKSINSKLRPATMKEFMHILEKCLLSYYDYNYSFTDQYNCANDLCKRYFGNDSTLLHNDPVYPCTLTEEFKSKEIIEQHATLSNYNYDYSRDCDQIIKNKKFICDLECPKSIEYKMLYYDHETLEEKDRPIQNDSGVIAYKCHGIQPINKVVLLRCVKPID